MLTMFQTGGENIMVSKITTLTIDEDAKNLIKQTQKVIQDRKNINMDLKDLVYLVFKNPEKAANIVSENFNSEMENNVVVKEK